MASATGFWAHENMATYMTAEQGAIGLTQTAALENARYGIRVNVWLRVAFRRI
ncbi:hypothetical protein ABZX51_003030 [Aspergillus tubingensis]